MKLIAVTDDRHPVKELAEKIITIKDIIDFVQIREKSKSAGELMVLLDILLKGGVEKEKIIINDRLDAALLKQIPNVHLPEHGLPVQMVKQQYPHLRTGRSVHSAEKAKEAEQAGADYVLFGHVFETASKKGKKPNGIKPLLEIKKQLRIPVYAIGGITSDKLSVLKETGADGIAVMSGIFQSEDPQRTAEKFSEAISLIRR
jgi:thiazole tautomerase (transcriptional regulator TenI)